MFSLSQLTDTVVMISPDQFGFNPQTANTNVFQHKVNIKEKELQQKAQKEFNNMVSILKSEGINVNVLPSRTGVVTPDAVFPNNWFSSHPERKIILYPMLAPNRRAERQPEELKKILSTIGINNPHIIDLSSEENRGKILEGTGSLVLDRKNKVAFAMESPRTTKIIFDEWCKKIGYQGIFFHAYDKDSLPIYHTNVTMSLGEGFAVACLESIKNLSEKKILTEKLKENGRKLIPISLKQTYSFCGNILQLKSTKGDKKIVLSKTAFKSFTLKQINQLKEFGELVVVEIPTIEKVGGGSARCMLAEIFL